MGGQWKYYVIQKDSAFLQQKNFEMQKFCHFVTTVDRAVVWNFNQRLQFPELPRPMVGS